MSSLYSFGIGVGTKNGRGEWLEVFYPAPLLSPPKDLVSVITSSLGAESGDIEPTTDQLSALYSALNHNGHSELASTIKVLLESNRPVSATLLSLNTAPTSVPQAFLKLHLLSHRLVKPHETELTGIFGVLKNVAWTSAGAIDIEELPDRLLQARVDGQPLSVDSVDKFPKMV
ncbi:MAG: 2,3,4,5-tetrahydropyridine-2,6-dicarboxylate N-succinyltransferase, partial [Porticoccaceae bacterium]|nr:2,3,4,5-tetrahydropyridine-2,6-dicarboxylate N-succinyltransferase [Porticoccaceae bacterium]